MDYGFQAQCITRRAGSDFSGSLALYRFVMATGSNTVLVANSQSAALPNAPIGISQTPVPSGQAATVAVMGISKVYAAGSFEAWSPLTTNSVGQAILAGSGDVVAARSLLKAVPGQQTDVLLSGVVFRLTGAA